MALISIDIHIWGYDLARLIWRRTIQPTTIMNHLCFQSGFSEVGLKQEKLRLFVKEIDLYLEPRIVDNKDSGGGRKE